MTLGSLLPCCPSHLLFFFFVRRVKELGECQCSQRSVKLSHLMVGYDLVSRPLQGNLKNSLGNKEAGVKLAVVKVWEHGQDAKELKQPHSGSCGSGYAWWDKARKLGGNHSTPNLSFLLLSKAWNLREPSLLCSIFWLLVQTKSELFVRPFTVRTFPTLWIWLPPSLSSLL